MILGFAMLFGVPFVLSQRPGPGTPRKERVAYLQRLLYYSGVLVGSMVCAGVGSVLIVRNARADYRDETMQNMKLLVEGTLEDHRQKGHDGSATD